jgi:hypothetical protein
VEARFALTPALAWQRRYDERRTAVLEQQGWRILRFWNNDVIENMEGVLERIAARLPPDRPHPSSLPQAGEGARTNGA